MVIVGEPKPARTRLNRSSMEGLFVRRALKGPDHLARGRTSLLPPKNTHRLFGPWTVPPLKSYLPRLHYPTPFCGFGMVGGGGSLMHARFSLPLILAKQV